MGTKAGRYALLGLAVDAAAVVAALLVLALYAASQYDGLCGLGIILGSGRHKCTLLESVFETTLLVSALAVIYGWWAILIALALPPLVGFLVGRRRPSGAGPARL